MWNKSFNNLHMIMLNYYQGHCIQPTQLLYTIEELKLSTRN